MCVSRTIWNDIEKNYYFYYNNTLIWLLCMFYTHTVTHVLKIIVTIFHVALFGITITSHSRFSVSNFTIIIMRYYMIETREYINKLFRIRRLIYCYCTTLLHVVLLLLIEYFSYLLHNSFIIALAFWINWWACTYLACGRLFASISN